MHQPLLALALPVLILLLASRAPSALHAAPDPEDASRAAPEALDEEAYYQPTLEQAFGMIARHDAAGFAGMRWPPGRPLTVFLTEAGDAEAAVDAVLEYIERSGEVERRPSRSRTGSGFSGSGTTPISSGSGRARCARTGTRYVETSGLGG